MVHVFWGNTHTHVYGMVKTFVAYSQENNVFILVCTDKTRDYHSLYSKLLEHNPRAKHIIIEPRVGASNPVKFVRRKLWLLLLKKYRREHIILHGSYCDSLFSFVLASIGFFPHLATVCWGNTRMMPRADTWLGKMRRTLQYIAFKNRTFIALTEPDAKILKRHKVKRVVVQPYPYMDAPAFNKDTNFNQKILLGNSAWIVKSYIDFLKKIPSNTGNLFLTVMMNYGDCLPEEKDELLQLLDLKFPSKYHIWDTVETIDKYNETLLEQSIYINNYPSQSGLGAIYTMIYLGKVVVLRGLNYRWMKQLGIKIPHVNEFLEQITMFSFDEYTKYAKQNRRQLEQLLDAPLNVPRWDQLKQYF